MKLLKATWNPQKGYNNNGKEDLLLLNFFLPLKMTIVPQNKFASNSKFCGTFKSILIEHLTQSMISVITSIILQMKKLRLSDVK